MNISTHIEETDSQFIVTAEYGDIKTVVKLSKVDYNEYVMKLPLYAKEPPINPIPHLEDMAKRELVNFFNNENFK